MALQLLLGAATTQEWLGHSLFEIASKPSCPFCYDIDGWAANPWVHLLVHCQGWALLLIVPTTMQPTELSEF